MTRGSGSTGWASPIAGPGDTKPAPHRYERHAAGADFLSKLGVDLSAARAGRRVFCPPCVDWTDRGLKLPPPAACRSHAGARPLQSPHQRPDPGTTATPPWSATKEWSNRSPSRLIIGTRQLGNFTSAQVGKIESALTHLKVPTQGPERANRRVTVRRITPLLTGQNQAVPLAEPQ